MEYSFVGSQFAAMGPGSVYALMQRPVSLKEYPGESWLCETSGFRIAIDVGQSESFAERAAAFSPHVLILSHDDMDHVGSMLAFLRHCNAAPCEKLWHVGGEWECEHRDCRLEVWMPIDWWRLALAAQACVAGGGAVKGQRVNPRRLSPIGTESDAELIKLLSLEGEDARAAEGPVRLVSDWFSWLDDGLDSDAVLDAVRSAVDDWRADKGRASESSEKEWKGTPEQIAVRSLQSAKRIGTILRQIAIQGLNVRFFDVDIPAGIKSPPWVNQGLPGRVTIINGVEAANSYSRPSAPVFALLYFAQLTVQNRRALATFVWPSCLDGTRFAASRDIAPVALNRNGIIVWSDTTAKIGAADPDARCVPWDFAGAMSAPHHASNDKEHKAIWRHRPPTVKVMLSANRTTDGPEFRQVPPPDRICSTCAVINSASGVTAASHSVGLSLTSHCRC